MSDLPKRVLIQEEGPREGFQSEKKMIPVADKVRLIEALAETGLGHIACVSYVNPKRVPTMADAEEVAQAIRRKPGIEYSALWLNQQGLERALRGPLHVEGGVRVTASDTFSRKNIGKSVPDALVEQRMSLKTFKERGMPVEWGIILGAFGCNYEGELSTDLILQRVQLARERRVDRVRHQQAIERAKQRERHRRPEAIEVRELPEQVHQPEHGADQPERGGDPAQRHQHLLAALQPTGEHVGRGRRGALDRLGRVLLHHQRRELAEERVV